MSAEEPPTPPGESLTALGVARQRAAHLVLDDAPPILDDPISIRLIGGDPDGTARAEAAIRAEADRFRTRGVRGLRSHLVVRSRFAEDELATAASTGLDQLVMLGAGLDTFAYRRPSWAAGVRVFEVDHPASQGAKRRRLAEAGIVASTGVTYVPVDLAVDPLVPALSAAGLDISRPLLVAWLGVMMYLPPAASDAVLGAIAGLPGGSEIVFTFAQPPTLFVPDLVAAAAARAGEPWLDRVRPKDLVARLLVAGFAEARVVDPDEIADRYFVGRTDLQPPRRATIATARTG